MCSGDPSREAVGAHCEWSWRAVHDVEGRPSPPSPFPHGAAAPGRGGSRLRCTSWSHTGSRRDLGALRMTQDCKKALQDAAAVVDTTGPV